MARVPFEEIVFESERIKSLLSLQAYHIPSVVQGCPTLESLAATRLEAYEPPASSLHLKVDIPNSSCALR